jgi:hypothetical protein
VSFVRKNCDFPFWVKRQVLDSALFAAVLYASESWLTENLGSANTMYMTVLKVLLGVRMTTSNDICLLELGYPSLKGFIKNKQRSVIGTLISEREHMEGDPFNYVWHLCKDAKTPGARYILSLLHQEQDFVTSNLDRIRESVRGSTRTKLMTYINDMNPELLVHDMYTDRSNSVPEYKRIAFTRLRVISHHLAIKTSLWSTLPRDRRLCQCGEIQTEVHIVCQCVRTAGVRAKYPDLNFSLPEIFNADNKLKLAGAILECLDEA